MRLTLLYSGILSVVILYNCANENVNSLNTNEYSDTIIIQTDRQDYNQDELIIVELTNYYGSIAYYYHCSSYDGIPPAIYKSENNSWTCSWAPVCDGFRSFCCLNFNPGAIYIDTIYFQIEPGTYKFGYTFLIDHSEGDKYFYSNTFNVK